MDVAHNSMINLLNDNFLVLTSIESDSLFSVACIFDVRVIQHDTIMS